MDPSGRFTVTSRGLSLSVYQKLNEAARDAGIPPVGHAPVNLGLDALLQTRQDLAPVATIWGLAAIIRRWRPASAHSSPALLRIRSLTRWVLVAGIIALTCAALFLPGAPLFDSFALRLLFTVIALFIAAVAVLLTALTFRTWRDKSTSDLVRVQASLVFIASLVLASALAIVWVPVAWRSTDSGIERLAQRVRDSGISVQTTLINYELLSGPERLALIQEPSMEYLDETVQTRWRRLPQGGSPGYAYHRFMKKVVGALHRAGVPLVAGTDAMGVPLLVPGASLHRELQLLTECGLTPYEAIRAATINAAVFLDRDEEFGTVAEGKRADLLLVGANPLQDLSRLKQPLGVMVRGTWLSRDDLRQRLAVLAGTQAR